MYISSYDDLKSFVDRAQSASIIGVDTEFLRERTYYPQLCLIQIATPDEIVLIDPLSIKDLTPVVELFSNPSITKVFHACTQDIEVIYDALHCIPAPLFDTQIAAAYLGERLQLGYGALVEAYCGVHLAKAESLTDWSRRPLDEAQMSYAADDVRYLIEIYHKMMDALIKLDRLKWVLPEFEAYTTLNFVEHDRREMFRRLKRVNTLSRRQLAVAREICAWREQRASQRNVPRKWIISDEIVLELSKRMPKDIQALRRIRGTEQLSERDGDAVVHGIACASALSPAELPIIERKPHPSVDEEPVIDLMYALTRIIAEREKVAVQLMATRDDLFAFMAKREQSRLSSGWRYDLLGSQLEGLLDGKIGLTVKAGHIEEL